MSRDAQAALRDKLRTENQFIDSLSRLLRNGVNFQNRQLELALIGHYNRTFDGFSRSYQDKHNIRMPKFQRLTMRDYLQGEFERRANRQAKLISDNSKRIWEKIQNMDLPPAEKQAMFQFRMGARSPVISSTETEWGAERTKLREVQFLQGGPESDNGTKRWDVVGDQLMRDHHADASGQTVPLDDAFSVGGEKLMHPGDPDLGASASNLVNCRCSLFYSIDPRYLTRSSSYTKFSSAN